MEGKDEFPTVFYRVVTNDSKQLTEDKEEAYNYYNTTLKKLEKEDDEDGYFIRLQVKSSQTKDRWKTVKERKAS